MNKKNISLRDAFGNALIELAERRDDFVVLDADVAGGTGVNPFRYKYPERFIQCGIAEQNMMSMAAGIASTGIIPIVTCYAVFASMRAIEQARNSVAYPHFNVKVIASHVGLDVGPDGASHQCLEDLAIYRAIPNFSVLSPADPIQLNCLLSRILDFQGPIYMRTGRSPVPDIHQQFVHNDFQIGKANVLKKGNDLSIIATGIMVYRALDAAEKLEKEGISARVINISTIKPIDKEIIVSAAQETKAIVTAEDHNIFGGLGSATAECVSQFAPCPIEFVGIKDTFGESGEPSELAKKYNLTSLDIYNSCTKVLSRRV
ncbi:MAG: transketolase family protein [Pseudomonadota bacterium]|nr:transketolase family protein [Pseudomonadota bacterium]